MAPLNDVIYPNRREAGVRLAVDLSRFVSKEALVVGIPRGGVEVGAAIAEQLGIDLEVMAARKIGATFQPELAIGAVTADGTTFLDADLIATLEISESYVQSTISREIEEAKRRERLYRDQALLPEFVDRVVIAVDDGLATGATMQAAARSIRRHHPQRLVVAVPVASIEAVATIAPLVDEVVCPVMPANFLAVGNWYEDFRQLSDDDVVRIIRKWHDQCANQQCTDL